jgi:hypothetical protein
MLSQRTDELGHVGVVGLLGTLGHDGHAGAGEHGVALREPEERRRGPEARELVGARIELPRRILALVLPAARNEFTML